MTQYANTTFDKKDYIQFLARIQFELEKENLKMIITDDIEELAKLLHESGREAVLNNKVVKKDGNPIGKIIFIEWDELPENAKEGRRIQARFLHNYCFIINRTEKIENFIDLDWENLSNESQIVRLDMMEQFLERSTQINQQVVQQAIQRIADEADKIKEVDSFSGILEAKKQ